MRDKLEARAFTPVLAKSASVLDQSLPVVDELASSNSPSEVLSLYSGDTVVIARNAAMELVRLSSSCVFVSFSSFSICSGFSLLLIL